MVNLANQLKMPKLICRDCRAEFYLWNFGRYTPIEEEQIVQEKVHLYCFHHITQEVAINAVGFYENINWN